MTTSHSAAALHPAACIALVDADEHFRTELGDRLTAEGYDVVAFGGREEALAHLAGGRRADVILLGWPEQLEEGAAALRAARSQGIDAPVICLATNVTGQHEETALAHGAQDFVGKARRLPILLKRMELIIGGAKCGAAPAPADEARRVVDDLELRDDAGRAFWKGAQVDLTLTEYRMVSMLASAPDQDFSYRSIYDLVHGAGFMAGYGSQGFRANVRAFIKRIRRKFKSIDEGFDRISNYPGFGYRWNAAATGAEAPPQAAPAEMVA